MRVARFVFSFLLVLALSPNLKSQQPTTSVQRDPQALAAIQQAIVAMGGSNAVAQVQTVIAQGSIASAPGANAPAGNFVSEDQFTSQGHEFKDTFQSAELTQNFVSGHGNPGLISNGQTRKFYPHVANSRLALHVPAIVLAGVLSNASYSINWVGSITINGQAAVQIHLHLDTDRFSQTLAAQDWYFDPASGLPLRVEYRVPDTEDPMKFINAAASFSDFRSVQGVLTPFRIQTYEDAHVRHILILSSVTFNQPTPSSDFDLPPAVAQ
jgi:hypothetical protein